ncbi:MAG: hypothetical protein QNK37_35565 [Acidobacteriota bacterium]|nr:hypothetical protein [Acidobacteriota bacterium]
MLRKGSRYEKGKKFLASATVSEPFGGLRPREIPRTDGVIEHRIRQGDRLDLLARHYYNDDRQWWRIVDANPGFLYGGDMVLAEDEPGSGNDETLAAMVGRVILIPRA